MLLTMKKPDAILNEIHATRCKFEEITKDMTAAERTAYFYDRGEEAAQKYGFNVITKVIVREFMLRTGV
jgi:hypothetical protein